MIPIDTSLPTQKVKDSMFDAKALNQIKAMGREQDPQALKEVAKQFEALFVQQMLKSMRAANEVFAEDSYFNSSEMQFHQDMYDQQMSLELTRGTGIGLADALYQQMLHAYGDQVPQSASADVGKLSVELREKLTVASAQQFMTEAAAPVNPFGTHQAAQPRPVNQQNIVAPATGNKTAIAETPNEFVAAMRPYAEKAAAELGVSSDALLAQAALETGWGKHVIHSRRSGNSYNLFNIKAHGSWSGEKVRVNTLEYAQGVAYRENAEFRRYNSYAESFADYVNFMQSNPRYQQALAVGTDPMAYAEALQKAGYATDPAYAQKIKTIVASDAIRTATPALAALANEPDVF